MYAEHGVVVATVADGKENDAEAPSSATTSSYSEPLADIPSHRALALFRGRNEDVLRVKLALDTDPEDGARRAPSPTRASGA
jgi:uncharacterized protein